MELPSCKTEIICGRKSALQIFCDVPFRYEEGGLFPGILLSLSLILALLRYKPAPVYILDEVDAALDMSHTQNIGKMIKEQFLS